MNNSPKGTHTVWLRLQLLAFLLFGLGLSSARAVCDYTVPPLAIDRAAVSPAPSDPNLDESWITIRAGQLATLRVRGIDTDHDNAFPDPQEIPDTVYYRWFSSVLPYPAEGVDQGETKQITFNEPGNYNVEVHVEDRGVGCTGCYLQQECFDDIDKIWTFHVTVTADAACPDYACSACNGGADSGGPSCGGKGPSANDPVMLSLGEEYYTPDPDLAVYNPDGPSASYQRSYYSGAARVGYGSPGLSPGWIDAYDYTISGSLAGWDDLVLTYPKGATETLNLVTEGNPSGGFTHAAGRPFLVSGTPSATVGVWNKVTLSWKDGSKWDFEPVAGSNALRLTTVRTPLDSVAYPSGTVIHRDASDRITSITDLRTGNTLLSFTYTNGLLSLLSDVPGGRLVAYAPDASGRLCTVTHPYLTGASSAVRFTYGYELRTGGPYLNAITVPSPTGTGNATASIVYEAGTDKVSTLHDANGNERRYTYGTNSATVSVHNPQGQLVQTFTKGFSGNLYTGESDADGYTMLAYGDTNCPYKPSLVQDKKGNQTAYAYDTYGNVLSETKFYNQPSRRLTTTSTYSYTAFPMGRLMSVQVGAKHPVSYTYYEPSGLVKTVTTVSPANPALDVTTSYEYDNSPTTPTLGNLTKVTAPGSNTAASLVTTYTYGAKIGRPLTEVNNLSKTTTYEYDARGNRTAVIDANTYRTESAYDAANQLSTITYPSTGTGQAVTDYDYLYPGGPLTTVSEYNESGALVRQVTHHYGPEGESLGTSEGTGGTPTRVTTTTYDSTYRVKTLADGKGSVTTYTYDYEEDAEKPGNLVRITYPPVNTVSDYVRFTGFDADGNPAQRITGRGTTDSVTTTYTYDPYDDQVTGISYSNGTASVSYEYNDAYRRRTKMTDGTGNTTYTYDDLDNLLTVATTFSGMTANPTKTLTYTYWPDGSRHTMAAPAGTVSYGYDGAGRMNTLSNPFGETVTWTYYFNGWLNTQTLYGSRTTTYTYNPRGFLTRLQNPASDFSSLTYDGIGNLTSMTASYFGGGGSFAPASGEGPAGGMEAGGADGAGTDGVTPLASTTYLSGTTTYRYYTTLDATAEPMRAYGPLRSESTTRFNNLGTKSFVYDAAYNPTTLRSTASLTYNADNQRTGPLSFVYDVQGNPTTYKGTSGLTYDAENRLTLYGTFSAGYNGNGLRAWKQVGSTKTFFLYDGTDLVGEFSASGTTQATNTFGVNGLVYRRVGSLSTYYAFDPMGNAVNTTDQGGYTLADAGYDAYGTRFGDAAQDPLRRRGPGPVRLRGAVGLLHRHRHLQQARALHLPLLRPAERPLADKGSHRVRRRGESVWVRGGRSGQLPRSGRIQPYARTPSQLATKAAPQYTRRPLDLG